jgi:hypothetical protein
MSRRRYHAGACLLASVCGCVGILHAVDDSQIGREVAVPVHLQDGEEGSIAKIGSSRRMGEGGV